MSYEKVDASSKVLKKSARFLISGALGVMALSSMSISEYNTTIDGKKAHVKAVNMPLEGKLALGGAIITALGAGNLKKIAQWGQQIGMSESEIAEQKKLQKMKEMKAKQI